MESEDLRRAIDIAVNFIAFRARSETEVRRRLRKADFSSEIEDFAVDRLKEMRLLDDKAFAGAYARDQILGRKRGPIRVKLGLRSLGVNDSIAVDAVETVLADVDQVEQASNLVERRWKRIRETSTALATKKKIHDFLVRRGYSHSTARLVVDRLEQIHDES